jgi:hypothetical protein
MTDKLWWDREAEWLAAEKKIPLNEAYDAVIMRGLMSGELQPFAASILMGHTPSQNVLHYVATMFLDDNIVDILDAATVTKMVGESVEGPFEYQTPHQIVTRRRKGKGRPLEPANLIRDIEAADRVAARMRELGAGTYDAAVKEIAAEMGLGGRTVANAYNNNRYGK